MFYDISLSFWASCRALARYSTDFKSSSLLSETADSFLCLGKVPLDFIIRSCLKSNSQIRAIEWMAKRCWIWKRAFLRGSLEVGDCRFHFTFQINSILCLGSFLNRDSSQGMIRIRFHVSIWILCQPWADPAMLEICPETWLKRFLGLGLRPIAPIRPFPMSAYEDPARPAFIWNLTECCFQDWAAPSRTSSFLSCISLSRSCQACDLSGTWLKAVPKALAAIHRT